MVRGDERHISAVLARDEADNVVIGCHRRPCPLRGQKVRFLRSMLRLSRDGLARALRRQRGAVARWEAEPDRAIPAAADGAPRMFYALKAGGERDARKLVDLLQETQELEHGESVAREIRLTLANDWAEVGT